MRRPLAALAVVLALAAGAYLRVRQQRARWWTRVERLCACNAPVVRRLDAMSHVPIGGFDRVVAAQVRTLTAGCEDLRAAMTRRSAVESLRDTALRVSPTPAHDRAQRDIARELALTCGEEHHVFWNDLRARTARNNQDDTPREIVRVASEFLRVRDAMCARRAALSGPPARYDLSARDADRQGRTCGE
jgi:hypothetical protein